MTLRLLVFNLATDPTHPALGFATGWLRALAERAAYVDVITMSAVPTQLPANVRVRSVGAEEGYSEPHRVLRFYQLLLRVVLNRRPDACFAHMMPLFASMAAPVLRPLGIPIVTWYAHPSLSRRLRIAHALSSAMVTSVPGAYPHRHDEKLHVIGQGIDGEHFKLSDAWIESRTVLCAGRISRSKGLPVLVRAVARLRASGKFEDRRLVFVGRPISDDDRKHLQELKGAVRSLGLSQAVAFVHDVTYDQMPHWYQRSDVHVNLTPAGFGDKVALEAMACGIPSIIANHSFADVLGAHRDQLLFPVGDESALARRIEHVLDMSVPLRRSVGSDLRRRVLAHHGLERLTDEIMRILVRLAA